MKTALALVVGILLGGAAVGWYSAHRGAPEKPAEHEGQGEREKEPEAGAHLSRGTNGEVVIKLSAEAREHAGLQTAPVAAVSVAREVHAFGRALDTAPLAAALAEIRSTTAAHQASSRDYERLKVLHQQDQNVSARALEAAEAAMTRDRLLAEAAQGRLLGAWGPALVGRADLEAWVGKFARQEAALVQVNVPLGEPPPANPVVARLAPAARPTELLKLEPVGPAATLDPQTQGASHLFLISAGGIPPGAPVTGWLEAAGERAPGVLVPASALVRHEGRTFLYLQMAEDSYQRVGVELDRPAEAGWLVREGVAAGAKVVVAGAQQLLSEELKSKGGEE
ncbi:MAG TPA: hypothetical protein DCM86_08355 [Verrucomicrobiales bacterium]|nr:hypothetical protein [Verrucomicrobiales bacterium]